MDAGSSGFQTGGDGVHFPTGDATFIYEEDMELMLLRVCANLRVGSPAFILRKANNAHGDVRFRYSVFMPNCARFINVHAEGPVCEQDRDARQQASTLILDKILAIAGYEILDYNYRKMLRLEEEKNRAVESLSKQVQALELENKELKEFIEMFNEMLED